MSLSSFLDAFNTGTGAAGTTIARSGYGFQPKAIIVWATKLTGTADEVTGALDAGLSFGFATGATSRRCVGHQSDDAAGSSATDSAQRDDAIVAMLDTAGAIVALLDIQSFDSDGVTFVVDDQFPASYRVMVLALGGSDLTDAAVGTYSQTATVASEDITALGFQPDCLFQLSASIESGDPPAITTDARLSLGVTDTALATAVLAGVSRDARPSMGTAGYCRAGDSMITWAASNPATIRSRSHVSAWLSNGFTVAYDTQQPATTNARVFYLALKGGQYKLATSATQTDTTTDINLPSTGSVGFTPTAGLVCSAGRAEDAAGTVTVNHETSIGAFTSSSAERAMALWDENGTGSDESAMAQENDACYVNVSTADAVDGIMHVTSVADPVVLRMADADPSASFFWALLFGSSAGGGSTTLTVADAVVALTMDSPSLTQANTLSVNDLAIALAIDAPSLTQQNTLAVQDAAIALSIDSPSLTQQNTLAVQDSAIALAIDSPALTQANVLAPADATIGLTMDSPTLSLSTLLDLAELRIALGIESPILAQQNVLAPQDASIALAIDGLSLTQANTLAVQDALIALFLDAGTVTVDGLTEYVTFGRITSLRQLAAIASLRQSGAVRSLRPDVAVETFVPES